MATVLSNFRQAKKNSYGSSRSLSSIKYIVIHNTGNNGDTSQNNVDYFATGNTRSAGAHIFIDQKGNAWSSVPLEYTAWSVGDSSNGHGTYYGKCGNSNSVSIELCDIVSKDCSDTMISKTKETIAWIKSKCPNIVDIIRHYDVTTKSCPQRYINNSKWQSLKSAISGGAYVAQTPEKLDIDGDAGKKTVTRWQMRMETPVDGVISGQSLSLKKYFPAISAVKYGNGGSTLIKAWQGYIGAEQDGKIGQETARLTRKALNLPEDGVIDETCIKILQMWLNGEVI